MGTSLKARRLRLTPYTPLEKDIQKAVLDLLRIHPAIWRAWRVNSGAADGEYIDACGVTRRQFVRFNTQAGHSDLMGVLRGGQAFFLEVKRPEKNPTDIQESFLKDMAAGGALAACVHSADEAKAVLDGVLAARRARARCHSAYVLDD